MIAFEVGENIWHGTSGQGIADFTFRKINQAGKPTGIGVHINLQLFFQKLPTFKKSLREHPFRFSVGVL